MQPSKETVVDTQHTNNELTNSKAKKVEKIITEKKRWIVLIAFCIFTFTNASAFTTYSPILDAASDYYHKSVNSIIWLSNIWMITYCVGGLPVLYLFNKNVRWTMIGFAGIQLIGTWIRYGAGSSYGLCYFGVFIITVAQLVLLQAPVVLAEIWFPNDERVMATSLAFFLNIQGLSYGSLISGYVVGGNPNKIHGFLFGQAFVMSAPILICLFFMYNKPKHPANIASTTVHLSPVESIKLIFCHVKNFFDVLALSLFLGMNWTFLSVIGLILDSDIYSSIDICWISTVMNLAGLLGGMVPTIILERQQQKNKIPNYDFFLRILSFLSFVTTVILAFLIQFKPGVDKVVTYVLCGIIGLGFNAYVPIAAQSMMETFYPMNENVGFTIFNMLANFIAFLGNLASGLGIWMIAGLMAPLFLYQTFVYKTKLARLQKEKDIMQQGKQKYQAEQTVHIDLQIFKKL